MPSPRRKQRFVLLSIILTILVIIYLSTGAQSTRSSPFYKKTVAQLQKTQEQIQDQLPALSPEGKRDETQEADEEEKPLGQGEPDAALKERLRVAEVAAKKSADDKWREYGGLVAAAEDKEKAQEKARAEAKAAEQPAQLRNTGKSKDAEKENGGAGGRKKFPADGNTEDGVAHVGPHAPPAGGNKPAADIQRLQGQEQQQVGQGGDGPPPPSEAAKEELDRILARAPVVVFSKSYCPHSKKAKRILTQAFTITPAPVVVELDQHEIGSELQALLLATTGRRTVPNILVNGKSIGGGDEMEALWKGGKMKEVLRKEGRGAVEGVVQNLEVLGEGERG